MVRASISCIKAFGGRGLYLKHIHENVLRRVHKFHLFNSENPAQLALISRRESGPARDYSQNLPPQYLTPASFT